MYYSNQQSVVSICLAGSSIASGGYSLGFLPLLPHDQQLPTAFAHNADQIRPGGYSLKVYHFLADSSTNHEPPQLPASNVLHNKHPIC